MAEITLYHAPQTRSGGVRTLLEEIGEPYNLHVLDMKAGEQREPAYLAINPMGKVPVIRHGDVIVTEQVAIFLYLADLYPQAGLAPPLGDPLRGPYLRWMVYYASCYEPALVDKAMKHPPAPTAMSPYGSFETMLETVAAPLAKTPYILGEKLSAADILWGNALNWGVRFGIVPATPVIDAYVARIIGRPAATRAAAMDAELVAEQAAKANG